ncbi:hypothetical protein [Streptomyces thermodiastaticus]|uniref:hypothetical protein n=2 Tax=Streptomyces thermodiastaticus TaxID=44061 RepID=UPI0019A5D3DF|nr:hypothetical protein [Streptomyces thermodiastaticus]MCE7551851.1 hypothetical protein [Streptomyces thermodiastaticus]GHF79757.1 hypothetical protein GCM10018787_30690 [Streptomyces thermodiastaticus]
MIMTRSHAITAGIAAAAALTATGITYATAAPSPQSAPAAAVQVPAQAPMGGDNGNNNSKGNEGNDHDDHDKGHKKHRKHHREGWIHVNERSYSAHPSGCITVISGLGSKTLNIRNDSHKTVEVFRGATCDNGAPIATVGPHSTSNGVDPGKFDSVKVKDGVIGSFRIVHDHRHGKDDH